MQLIKLQCYKERVCSLVARLGTVVPFVVPAELLSELLSAGRKPTLVQWSRLLGKVAPSLQTFKRSSLHSRCGVTSYLLLNGCRTLSALSPQYLQEIAVCCVAPDKPADEHLRKVLQVAVDVLGQQASDQESLVESLAHSSFYTALLSAITALIIEVIAGLQLR